MSAGKVENGIVSGLDWFPTLVAAAGNPNIAEELKKAKQLGDRTYMVYLDGDNQMDMITGKGPSKRNEIFYFAETNLGAVRINDFKYRFIDQPNGWLGAPTRRPGEAVALRGRATAAVRQAAPARLWCWHGGEAVVSVRPD